MTIYKINHDVFTKYLTDDDEDIREIAKDSKKSFEDYINIISTFKTDVEQFKGLSPDEFKSEYSKIDKKRADKHNLTISNLTIMNRLAETDGLQLIELPNGLKPNEVNRTEIAQSLMLWKYELGALLSDEMLEDLGLPTHEPKDSHDYGVIYPWDPEYNINQFESPDGHTVNVRMQVSQSPEAQKQNIKKIIAENKKENIPTILYRPINKTNTEIQDDVEKIISDLKLNHTKSEIIFDDENTNFKQRSELKYRFKQSGADSVNIDFMNTSKDVAQLLNALNKDRKENYVKIESNYKTFEIPSAGIDCDEVNINQSLRNLDYRQPKINRNTPDLRLGDIVYTRCRFDEFIDEPYDIINSGFDIGYANSKVRPMLIFGKNEGNIVLAQIRTNSNATNWNINTNTALKLSKEELVNSGLDRNVGRYHKGGAAIGCAGLRQVKEEDLTIESFVGSLPIETLGAFTKQYANYVNGIKNGQTYRNSKEYDVQRPKGLAWLSNLTYNDTIKTVTHRESSRISKKDPIIYAEDAKQRMASLSKAHSAALNHDIRDWNHIAELESALEKTKIEKSAISKVIKKSIGITSVELAEHKEAIKYGYGTDENISMTNPEDSKLTRLTPTTSVEKEIVKNIKEIITQNRNERKSQQQTDNTPDNTDINKSDAYVSNKNTENYGMG